MNIFTSIFNTLKDGATQIGEAPVKSDDISVFEEAIDKASAQLEKAIKSKQSLQALVKQKAAKHSLILTQISQAKMQALAAANKGNENEALNIASSIIVLEEQQQQSLQEQKQIESSLDTIEGQIAKFEQEVQDMNTYLSQVKATEKVHKAQESIQKSFLDGKTSVSSAKDSLERLKAKQAQHEAEYQVAEEISDFMHEDNRALDKKLKQEKSPKNHHTQSKAEQLLQQLRSQQKDK